MKHTILASLVAAAVLTASACGRKADAEPKSVGNRVAGVDEFMKNVDANRGEVVVEGIVSAVEATDRRVALIDSAEFEHCGVVTCAENTLPVRWAGELPAVEERVRVRGKVEEEGGKLVFVAASAEKFPAGGKRK